MSDSRHDGDITDATESHAAVREGHLDIKDGHLDAKNEQSVLEVIPDEAALFASPLPITGERKTTTRTELWVCVLRGDANCRAGTCTMSATAASARSTSRSAPGRTSCILPEQTPQRAQRAETVVSHQTAD